MANGNLITQAEKMYQSELDTTDYAKLLTEPAVKAVGDMLKVQRVKTEALMAAMPAGVNISKVPEELRGKVTAYLTENKAAYTEAAKVVASGIKPTDQRYIDAIETMNRVRGGFEALDASLVNIAEKRKAALESRDNISAGAHDHDSILHEKWSNGSIYNDFTLEDGNFYYTDHEGNKVNANDYAGAMQQSTGITDGMVAQSDRARELGNKGYSFEEEEGNFRGSINSMLKNAGKNGRVDFAYSGVYGVEETPFIDTYIKDRLNLQKHDDDGSGDISQAEFDKWHAYYKNEDFSAGTEMGDKLREYLIGTLRNSYDSGVNAKEEANREARERKFDKPEIYGAYRSKKDIDDMNEAIKNRQRTIIGFNNEQYTYNPDTDKYDMVEDGKTYSYSADDVRIRQKIYGYKTGEDPTPDTQITDDDEVKIPKVAIEDVITESNLEVIEEEKSGKFIKYYSYSGNSITDADAALEAAKNAGIEDAFLIYENNGKEIGIIEYSRLEDKSNVTFKVQLGVGKKSMKVEGTNVEGTEVEGAEVEGTEVEETDIEETDVDETGVDETEVEEVEAEGTTEEVRYGPNNPDPMTGTPNTSGDMILNESGKYIPIDSKEGKRIAANYGSAQEKNEERIEGAEYGPDNPDPLAGQINTSGDMILNESGEYIPIDSEQGKKIAKKYLNMQDEVTISASEEVKGATKSEVKETVKNNAVLDANIENTGNTNPIKYIIDNGYINVNEAQVDSPLVKTIDGVFGELLGTASDSLAVTKPLTHKDKAWCGAFVYSVLTGTGAMENIDEGDIQKEVAYSKIRAADYLKVGTATKEPKMGDIMVVSRMVKNKKGKLEKRYHVAFYAGTDDNGKPIMLGGNQDDEVSFKIAGEEYTIEGYRRMENMSDIKEATVTAYKTEYGVKGKVSKTT